MDGELREALKEAQGRSEFIIVVVADIRGFSPFSERNESTNVAMYIKRVYIRLIDDYFPFATFYKATGDGLLLTVPFDEKTLQDKAQITVDACLRSLREFADVCKDDPMINFSTPDKIGFGVARGTACCLTSGDTVLDYSGHLLNLTTRLMDLARPSGIVLDGAFGIELLPSKTRQLFGDESVYVRSVAEAEPMNVHYLTGAVEIPEQAKRPIHLEQWETIEYSRTIREWKATPNFTPRLPRGLRRPDGVKVELWSPVMRQRAVVPNLERMIVFDHFSVKLLGNQPHVRTDVEEIIKWARAGRLRQDSKITMRIHYVPE